MISERLQAFLADPQGFFQNSDNVFFATIMVFFVVFTAARLLRLRQSQVVPVVMVLIGLLVLLQNGLLVLNLPTLFFITLLVIALIVGLRYLPGFKWPS
ncbi:MAG: hypothetical protein KF893_10500 [Caldilineaceae bacterium]|nr:hypothetical protein [Caldilineaceae bacterium]